MELGKAGVDTADCGHREVVAWFGERERVGRRKP